MSIISKAAFQDEATAFEYLEKTLWPAGPVCPHCGVIGNATKLQGRKGEGKRLCIDIIQQVREIPGVRGVHIMAYKQEELVPEIVEEAGLLKGRPPLPEADPVHLPALLVEAAGVSSTSEARRLIAQGGVKLDGAVVTEFDVPRERLAGAVLQAGKRRFVRLVAAA